MMNAIRNYLLGCTSLFMIAVPASAQVTDGSQAGGRPNKAADSAEAGPDIVVTAQRRSEKLQDVPVSISAIGGDQLAAKRVTTANDLVGPIPNLRSSNITGTGTPVFALRGVSESDYSVNQQGPVATYFDEVYKGSFPLLPVGAYDLERVEVLRGPQGTLYGKNTTGGAINFISRTPEYDATGGNVSVGYGNYNRIDASGALNVALGDRVAARIAFTYANADGWFTNLLPGKPAGNATREYGIRFSLRARPTERLEFILRAQTSLQNPIQYAIYAPPTANGVGNGIFEAYNSGSSYFRTGVGRLEQTSNYAPRMHHRTAGASLTGTWDATDKLKLTSVTSYDYGNVTVPEDADGSPLDVLSDTTGGRAWQFSQDLRLSSDFSSGPNFILGAYYNHELIKAGSSYAYLTGVNTNGDGVVNAADCQVDFFTACVYRNSFRQARESAAVYSDVNWKVTGRLTLRGGLRYTRDTGQLTDFKAQLVGVDGTPIANTIPGDPNDFDATTSQSYKKGTVTGKAGVDFKIDASKMIYASYSRGYRANAFNAQAYFFPSELGVAKPETVRAYEAGFKTQFFGRALTVNGAVFYYDYRDQQALSVDPATLAQHLINVDKSRIFGGELEIDARPVRGVHLFGNIGVLRTKILKGTLSGVDIAGNQLPTAPRFSASGGIDVDLMDNSSGKVVLGADASYVSRQYFELFNEHILAQAPYALLNARLSYRTSDGRYGLSAWAKNLTGKFYRTAAIDATGLGFLYFHVGEPRTYGLTLDAKF